MFKNNGKALKPLPKFFINIHVGDVEFPNKNYWVLAETESYNAIAQAILLPPFTNNQSPAAIEPGRSGVVAANIKFEYSNFMKVMPAGAELNFLHAAPRLSQSGKGLVFYSKEKLFAGAIENTRPRNLLSMVQNFPNPVQFGLSIYFSTNPRRPYFINVYNTVSVFIQSLQVYKPHTAMQLPQLSVPISVPAKKLIAQ